MTPAKVSVLTTVFNGMPYLAETVDSILNQTLKEIEHVIVDDGSNDETTSFLQSLKDPRVKVIQLKRVGRGHALNRGLQECQADYVAILDADDLSFPQRLEIQHGLMMKYPDMAVISCTPIFKQNNLERNINFDFSLRQVNPKILIRFNPLPHSGAIIRKSALVAVGGYDPKLKYQFDYDLWIRLAAKGYHLAQAKTPLVFKRIHKGQHFERRNRINYLKSGFRHRLRAMGFFSKNPLNLIYPISGFIYGLLPLALRKKFFHAHPLLITNNTNVHVKTVNGFGWEWSRFTQNKLPSEDHSKIFEDYFNLFPWDTLPKDGGVGADIGCGSGRWAKNIAPRVKNLYLIDASYEALAVAKKNLAQSTNVEFYNESVENLSIKDNSLDFAYSLGVLHHVPNTLEALKKINHKLKMGAPFLVYLYYAFDNRKPWYRWLWKLSELGRFFISKMPRFIRFICSDFLALFVYLPFAKAGLLLEKIGKLPSAWPLSYYRDKSFYCMRTDALDRFGTVLEKRFTKKQITSMLEEAGFDKIDFSPHPPFWVACALKK